MQRKPVRKKITPRTKELNLDAIDDTVHEMCKDVARHEMAFEGFLKRYSGKTTTQN